MMMYAMAVTATVFMVCGLAASISALKIQLAERKAKTAKEDKLRMIEEYAKIKREKVYWCVGQLHLFAEKYLP